MKSLKTVYSGILITICLTLLSSCYSYRSYTETTKEKTSHQPLPSDSTSLPKVFVTNQSAFPKEYRILRKANIYSISDDSTTAVKVRLKKLSVIPYMFCMTGPFVVLVGTLGQFPVRIPEKYSFSFEEIKNNEHKELEYVLLIDKRIWFWDILSWKKSRNKELAKALQKGGFTSSGLSELSYKN